MSALAQATKYANDRAPSGFRDLCLAALVNKARSVVASPPPGDATALSYAKGVFANSVTYQDSASWVVATDPNIYVQVTALPTEASILAAIDVAWPVLSHLASLA